MIALMVAGTSSGSGKTTFACGLTRALVRRGLSVRTYKLGPDFIDRGFLATASGRACINLDRFLLTPPGAPAEAGMAALQEEFLRYRGDADALIVESVGGLFDDWLGSTSSPAAVAQLLGIPVVLVAAAFASCQTVGIMASALLRHDDQLAVAGVVFSMVTSADHYETICQGVDPGLQPLLLGYLPHSRELYLAERHLGLPSAPETAGLAALTDRAADAVEQHVALDRLLSATAVPGITGAPPPPGPPTPQLRATRCRIAVARDQAFSFYYAANLEYLEQLGATLVPFSPLADAHLPGDVDAVYLGGGFPELHLPALATNEELRRQLRARAEEGLPVYAECGGLMYLAEEIEQPGTGTWYPGAGVLPLRCDFAPSLELSYVTGRLCRDCLLGPRGSQFPGHLFHRYRAEPRTPLEAVYSLDHHDGSPGCRDGFSVANVVGSFVHLHFRGAPAAAEAFVAHARRHRAARRPPPHL